MGKQYHLLEGEVIDTIAPVAGRVGGLARETRTAGRISTDLMIRGYDSRVLAAIDPKTSEYVPGYAVATKRKR